MADQEINTSEEIWKPIPGFEGYYDISNQGRIRSYWRRIRINYILDNRPQRILRLGVRKDACVVVILCNGIKRASYTVHKLVLLAFIGPRPPGMECCHNDGNRSNNFLNNIRWDTHISNCVDRDNHNATACGIRLPQSKLTENQVKQIRELASKGHRCCELGKRFSISHSVISNIVSRKTWKHI